MDTTMKKAMKFTILFSFLSLAGRIIGYICIPPWLDALSDSSSPFLNISNETGYNDTDVIDILPGEPSGKQISAFFVILGRFALPTIIFGSILLVILVACPHHLKDDHKKISHRTIFISGFSQAISAILMNYAMSGSRSPPYLQALLANFTIPIQFVVRFLVLRKPSTRLRLICAGIVVISEFISLIPSIFPGLETASQRKEDRGATGAGRILWPLSIIISLVPFTLANAFMERSVQGPTANEEEESQPKRYDLDTNQTTEADDSELLVRSSSESQMQEPKAQINIFYYGFWWSAAGAVTTCAFFWVDIIPGFGTSPNIHILRKSLAYNAGCLVGMNGCGPSVYMTGWMIFVGMFISTLGFTGLMRYSEGANFVVIVLSLRTPIVFLVWTLFDEHPLAWHPHISLSTWLSVSSVVIMLPAIVIYQTGLPRWNFLSLCKNRSFRLVNDDQDIQSLNQDHQDHQNQHILSRDQ